MPFDGASPSPITASPNPRYSHYTYEWAADQAPQPLAKSALLLKAAGLHRRNARERLALVKSHGWSADCSDSRQAYEALDWALIAVCRATYYRKTVGAA